MLGACLRLLPFCLRCNDVCWSWRGPLGRLRSSEPARSFAFAFSRNSLALALSLSLAICKRPYAMPDQAVPVAFDVLGTCFDLRAAADPLRNACPTLKDAAPELVNAVIDDWFHSTQRDFTCTPSRSVF